MHNRKFQRTQVVQVVQEHVALKPDHHPSDFLVLYFVIGQSCLKARGEVAGVVEHKIDANLPVSDHGGFLYDTCISRCDIVALSEGCFLVRCR